MALSVKIFNGKLNLDSHSYRLPQGDYLDALNITRESEGDGEDEVVSNIIGNVRVSTSEVVADNIFGALIAGTALTSEQKAAVLNSLNAKYGRVPIFLSSFGGSNGLYNAYIAGGLEVILNINNQPVVDGIPNPYPIDMAAYAAGINSVLDVYQPPVVIIENEEQNEVYYSGTPEEYIAMLEVAIPLVHARALKVSNGGLLYAPVAALIYWEMIDLGQTTEAAAFLSSSVPPSYWDRFTDPGSHPDWVTYVNQFQTLIDYYATSDLDYVNFHVYEPANVTTADNGVSAITNAIPITAAWLRNKTGKQIITNEVGQKNINATLTTNILQACIDSGLKYIIWYSGDSDEGQHAKALTETDGTLRVTGQAFANFISTYLQSSNILVGVNGNMSGSNRPFSDADVQAAIINLGDFDIMRYPGGEVANSFNWHTGKDDDGSGKANTLADIAALYNAVGCDILFVLNMLTKTMSDQLDMLAAANALGIPIKYVELGNELNSQDGQGHIQYPTPEDYAADVVIWMAAIKAVYPNALVAAVGGNKPSWTGGERWNEVVAAANPDALTWHVGPNPVDFSTNGVADLDLLEAEIMYDYYKNGIDLVSLPIWATEFNYTYDETNLLTQDSRITTTLYMLQRVAALINTNADKIKIMCVRGIEGIKEGAISITADAITVEATGYALMQYLYSIAGGTNGLASGVNKVIGGKEDLVHNRYYVFIWNSGGLHTIVYYDGASDTIVKVLESKTDSGGVDILQFDPSEKIHSVDIIYTNDGDILSFVDSLKRPSQINVDKAISGFYGTWQRSFLDVAKEPPSLPPQCIFEDDGTVTVNNFKKRLFKFRHRFEFENFEKSVYSAESEIPLPYNVGNPDFDTDPTKNAMVSIVLETGALNVNKVELVGAVSLGNTFSDYFLIASFDKDEMDLDDNDTFIYQFYNDKQYPTVDINEILQPYDYVPREANTQAMANGNTKEYAGILEGYNKVSIDGNEAATALDNDAVFQYPKSLLYASQSGANIHIIVLGTIQDNDVFNIYSTNEAFQYIASTGDTTADVIAGLAADALTAGFTIVSSDDNNLYVFKAGETFEYYIEIPDTPADFSDVTPAWDWASKYSFGVVYFDSKGRSMGGVNTLDIMTIETDVYDSINNLPYVDVLIQNRPPLDSRYFHIVRAKDLAKVRPLQWISDRTFKDDKYAYISIAALNQYIADNPSTATQLGYTYVPGDRIRFLHLYDNDGAITEYYTNTKDYEILASVQNPMINGVVQIGQLLKIALPAVDADFDFDTANFDNYFIELYTPVQSVSNDLNVYYEFGQKYDILDAGTANRRHQGMLVNQSADLSQAAYYHLIRGDYYYRSRDIDAGSETKFTVEQAGSGVHELDILGLLIASQSFNARGYTIQSTTYGGYTGNLNDSNNWFIQITDGEEHTFQLTGNITVKSVNSSAQAFDIKVYATNASSTLSFTIAHAVAPIADNQTFNFTIDTTFTVPAGYDNVYLLFITPDTGFEASIISGNLILNEEGLAFTVNVIDQNFSDFFLSSVNSNGRAWIIEPNAKEEYNPVKIRFSQEFDQDSNSNGLNRFYEDNFVEIDRGAGDIQRLFVDARILYAFQKFDIGYIPILTQIVKDVSGNPLEANSDILLNKVSYPFKGKFGIGDAPCSLAYGKGMFYFADTNRKVICAFASGGSAIQSISAVFDLNSFFIENLAAYRRDKNNGFPATGQPYMGDPTVYGIFNQYTNRYIIALEEINRYDENGNLIFHQDPQTLTFVLNDKNKGFESFVSYHPEWLGVLETMLLSFINGETWTHNSNVYCNFYGTQYEVYIIPVFNDKMLEKKSWIGLTETSNVVWDCPEITTQVNTYGSTPQSSRLPAARFTLQEGEWCASFLRDTNSYGGLLNGQYLKGNYIKIKFRVQNASTFVYLNAVGVKFNVSKLVAS